MTKPSFSMSKWENNFDKLFEYRKQGQWLRNIDGYEDENGKFIKQPHQAYMVPDFIKSFLSDALDTVEREVREEIIKEVEKLPVGLFDSTPYLKNLIESLKGGINSKL